MSTLEKLQQNNPHIPIFSLLESSFQKFATLYTGFEITNSIQFARQNATIGEAVAYKPSVAGLEADTPLMENLSRRIFGGMPIELGWVYGRNTKLNALEYHKGSEVHIAMEDFIALVGRIEDLRFDPKPSFDSANLSAYYVPTGSVVEFHAWCMHFAPIHVCETIGFLNLVALPEKSNTALGFKPIREQGEAMLLFAWNNWLIAHPEDRSMTDAGAFAGIDGINLQIFPLN